MTARNTVSRIVLAILVCVFTACQAVAAESPAGDSAAPTSADVPSSSGTSSSRGSNEQPLASSILVGEPASLTEGTDALGLEFKLRDYRGRVVVLMFSANWCGACKQMYLQMRELIATYETDCLAVLSVMADEYVETINLAGAKEEITWRVWHDGPAGPIAKNWMVRKWPTVYVIDHRGVVESVDPRGADLNAAVKRLVVKRNADPESGRLVAEYRIPQGPYFDRAKTDAPEDEQRVVVVFARHLTFMDGQPTTWEEIQKRIVTLSKSGPVRACYLSSRGNPDMSKQTAKIDEIRRQLQRPRVTIGSLSEKSSRRWDEIVKPEDLIPEPARVRRGTVVFANARNPAANAQVVIIPRERPPAVALKDGLLHTPWDHQWTSTNSSGAFAVAPSEEDYLVAILHSDGFGLFEGPLAESDVEFTLKPWASLRLLAEKIATFETAHLAVRPEGFELSLSFSFSGFIPTRRHLDVRVPAGEVIVSRSVDMGEGVFMAIRERTLRIESGVMLQVDVLPLTAEQLQQSRSRYRKSFGKDPPIDKE